MDERSGWLTPGERAQEPLPEDDAVTYFHLADDGGIFAVRGDTGQQAWLDESDYLAELDRLAAMNGAVLYSRDRPDRDPPEAVERRFAAIADRRLPIKLLPEPHPAVTGAPWPDEEDGAPLQG